MCVCGRTWKRGTSDWLLRIGAWRFGVQDAVCCEEPWLWRRKKGALATMRARCKVWVYLGALPVTIATIKRPPRKNKNYPEASGIDWQPKKQTRKTGLVLTTQLFEGSMGCLGGVHFGMATVFDH